MSEPLSPISVIVLIMLMGILPIMLMLVTSYVKIVVVAFIVRNALGIQQAPPNMVLTSLAMILSVFVMAPVGVNIYHGLEGHMDQLNSGNLQLILQTIDQASTPLYSFLEANTDPNVLSAFENTARRIWPSEIKEVIAPKSLIFVIPSFVISELTSAFQIGFLLYLPFIIIDLIISNILLAMGMMMVSPTTISLPFKLLLFVSLEGWLKLSQGLMLSYNYG